MEERCLMETGVPIGWKDWRIQLHYVSLYLESDSSITNFVASTVCVIACMCN